MLKEDDEDEVATKLQAAFKAMQVYTMILVKRLPSLQGIVFAKKKLPKQKLQGERGAGSKGPRLWDGNIWKHVRSKLSWKPKSHLTPGSGLLRTEMQLAVGNKIKIRSEMFY